MAFCTIFWYIHAMRLSPDRIRSLCHSRGTTLTALLRDAAVSRTAYYSLARKQSVLPSSLIALAAALGVREDELLETRSRDETRTQARLNEARRVLSRHPAATFENVWHALILLDLPPVERLRRSLVRGRPVDFHS